MITFWWCSGFWRDFNLPKIKGQGTLNHKALCSVTFTYMLFLQVLVWRKMSCWGRSQLPQCFTGFFMCLIHWHHLFINFFWLPLYLGDELNKRLSSELLNLLCVQTGQVVELNLLLCFTAAVKRSILYKEKNSKPAWRADEHVLHPSTASHLLLQSRSERASSVKHGPHPADAWAAPGSAHRCCWMWTSGNDHQEEDFSSSSLRRQTGRSRSMGQRCGPWPPPSDWPLWHMPQKGRVHGHCLQKTEDF